MNLDEATKELFQVLRSLDRIMAGREISGRVKTDHESDIEEILREDYSSGRCYYSHNLTFQKKETLKGVEITLDRQTLYTGTGIVVYWDKDQFLEFNRRDFVSDNFLIFAEFPDRLLNKSDDIPFLVEYRSYLAILKVIIESAEMESHDYQVTILNEDRKKVVLEIDKGCLIEDFSGVRKIIDKLEAGRIGDGFYIDEFRMIVRSQIYEIANRYNTRKVSCLMENFGELKEEILRNYYIFVSKYNFATIKDNFLFEKAKYIEIVDKYVGTVQSAVFSIPVSVGLGMILKANDSSRPFDEIIVVISYLFYATIAILIILHNNKSIEITKNMLKGEQDKLGRISSCDGELPEDADISTFFDLFNRKLHLVKILSWTTIITLSLLTLYFILRLIIKIPFIHSFLKILYSTLVDGSILKYFADLARFIFQ